MSKIIFMNGSPNKNGNTFRIGEELLKNKSHDVLHMVDYRVDQYGVVTEADEIAKLLKQLEDKKTIVIGAPVYWYTVGGILKTFIDRLYMLPESEVLKGKKLYFFAQGSAPDEGTVKTIEHLASRVAELMGMDLKSVIVDSSDGRKILSNMSI